MSTTSEGFFKQLRRDVKNKASNWKILQFLNTIYETGYAQGLKDARAKIEETVQNAYNKSNSSDHND